MVVRAEEMIEGDIADIRNRAVAENRELTAEERERIDDLTFERAAAYRVWDQQRRQEHYKQARAHWRPMERARMRAALRPSPIFFGMLGVLALSGYLLWSSPSDRMARPLTILFLATGWMISLCMHEFGHAVVAWLGGDDTQPSKGTLKLDPRAYTNPLFSIIMPLVFLLMGGFPLPGGAVMVETSRLRSRRWDLATSAAGPAGTLLFLLLAVTPFLIFGDSLITYDNFYFWSALGGLVMIQVSVLIINLLPIPPLDGFHIASHWFDDGVRAQAHALGPMPMLLFFFGVMRIDSVNNAFWDAVNSITVFLRIPDWLGGWALSQLWLW